MTCALQPTDTIYSVKYTLVSPFYGIKLVNMQMRNPLQKYKIKRLISKSLGQCVILFVARDILSSLEYHLVSRAHVFVSRDLSQCLNRAEGEL